jgi:hypothetical protein
MQCTKTPNPRYDDSEMVFSQPLYTKDHSIALVTYELLSYSPAGVTLTRNRQTLVLKFNGKEWEDAHFLEMQIMEMKD